MTITGQKTNVRVEPVQVEIVKRMDPWTSINAVATLFLHAWFGMLILGALHANHAAIPAVSYWDSWLGLFLLSIVGDMLRPSYRLWTKRGLS